MPSVSWKQHSVSENEEVLPNYRLTRFLGQGGFGRVWEAEAPGGILKAIKIVPIAYGEEGWRGRELEGLQKIKSIRHPYLLSLERFEVVAQNLVIVTELAESNLADLYQEYRKQGYRGIPRSELLRYVREAAEVLDLLSEKFGLQHLDIKPENLFLSGGHVKVGDFGLVQPTNSVLKRSSVAITPPYAPPELFDGKVDGTADQYSLAVTYQELLTGTRPFDGDVREILAQILREQPNLSAVSKEEAPILKRAYNRSPQQRYPSCMTLVESLTSCNPTEENHLVEDHKDDGVVWTPTIPNGTRTVNFHGKEPRRMFAANDIRRQTRGRSDTKRLDELASTRIITKPLDQPEQAATKAPRHLKVAFIAFLPLEIYIHKVRGFADSLKLKINTFRADIVQGVLERNQWLARTNRSFEIEIKVGHIADESDYSLVEVSVATNDRSLSLDQFSARAQMLIQVLRAHLMVVEGDPTKGKTDAQVRAEILQ